MANRWENNGNSDRLYFGGLQNHCRWWLQHEIKRCLLLGRKAMTNLVTLVTQACLTLWDPMDCSPLGSSVHGLLQAILIPACGSSSLAYHVMYSAFKLNKQGDNIQPRHTPFPIWNQSAVSCPVLTGTSWLAYRFLRRQVRSSGIPISWRIFHSLLWSTQLKALA